MLGPSITTSALKMETVCFSEALVTTDESARRQNPEEQHQQVLIQFPNKKTALQSVECSLCVIQSLQGFVTMVNSLYEYYIGHCTLSKL
jgi:hypothetical protein